VKIEYNLTSITELAGLTGNNLWNLATTVENNILGPLREYGYIDSYEKVSGDRSAPKYIIKRFSR
jgi:ribosomal protein S8